MFIVSKCRSAALSQYPVEERVQGSAAEGRQVYQPGCRQGTSRESVLLRTVRIMSRVRDGETIHVKIRLSLFDLYIETLRGVSDLRRTGPEGN